MSSSETISESSSEAPEIEIEHVITCSFDPPHEHIYPADWTFGGSDGTDPRADERYKPDTYYYFDDQLRIIHVTQVPLCDDEAVDRFTEVAAYGPNFNPVFLHVRRHEDSSSRSIPVTYDKATDTVYG
jgi:hypothetical protein